MNAPQLMCSYCVGGAGLAFWVFVPFMNALLKVAK